MKQKREKVYYLIVYFFSLTDTFHVTASTEIKSILLNFDNTELGLTLKKYSQKYVVFIDLDKQLWKRVLVPKERTCFQMIMGSCFS